MSEEEESRRIVVGNGIDLDKRDSYEIKKIMGTDADIRKLSLFGPVLWGLYIIYLVLFGVVSVYLATPTTYAQMLLTADTGPLFAAISRYGILLAFLLLPVFVILHKLRAGALSSIENVTRRAFSIIQNLKKLLVLTDWDIWKNSNYWHPFTSHLSDRDPLVVLGNCPHGAEVSGIYSDVPYYENVFVDSVYVSFDGISTSRTRELALFSRRGRWIKRGYYAVLLAALAAINIATLTGSQIPFITGLPSSTAAVVLVWLLASAFYDLWLTGYGRYWTRFFSRSAGYSRYDLLLPPADEQTDTSSSDSGNRLTNSLVGYGILYVSGFIREAIDDAETYRIRNDVESAREEQQAVLAERLNELTEQVIEAEPAVARNDLVDGEHGDDGPIDLLRIESWHGNLDEAIPDRDETDNEESRFESAGQLRTWCDELAGVINQLRDEESAGIAGESVLASSLTNLEAEHDPIATLAEDSADASASPSDDGITVRLNGVRYLRMASESGWVGRAREGVLKSSDQREIEVADRDVAGSRNGVRLPVKRFMSVPWTHNRDGSDLATTGEFPLYFDEDWTDETVDYLLLGGGEHQQGILKFVRYLKREGYENVDILENAFSADQNADNEHYDRPPARFTTEYFVSSVVSGDEDFRGEKTFHLLKHRYDEDRTIFVLHGLQALSTKMGFLYWFSEFPEFEALDNDVLYRVQYEEQNIGDVGSFYTDSSWYDPDGDWDITFEDAELREQQSDSDRNEITVKRVQMTVSHETG